MDLDEQDEYRDIRVDYPGIDDVVHQEELGYRKSAYIFNSTRSKMIIKKIPFYFS